MDNAIFEELSQGVQGGKAKDVKAKALEGIEAGIAAKDLLENGLLAGMSVVGVKFKNNEVYVPDVLIAARAMNAGVEELKPYLAEGGSNVKGKAVLGTVKGDLHDIGKNLVKIMLEGKGLEVIDIGVDAAPEKFIDTALENKAQVICASALLTTTMGVMQDIVDLAKEKGVRDQFKIMIGGAPVTQNFCDTIGADFYTEDAASAGEVALQICQG